MVVGKLPFVGNTHSEVIDKIINQEFKFTKTQETELSKEIRDLLHKLFTKEFKQRISMNDILDHPWTVRSKMKEEEQKLDKVPEETKTKTSKSSKQNLQKRNSDKISPNRPKNQIQPKKSVNYGKNGQLVSQLKKK